MDRRLKLSGSFRTWATVLIGSAFVIAVGLFAFIAYAQSAKDGDQAERNLTNGRLAFTRRSAGPAIGQYVLTANPDGSDSTFITNPGELLAFEPAWSPDGTRLAFSGTPGDIYVINSGGTGQANLTNTASPISESNPSWSVTDKIAYTATNTQTFVSQIRVMNSNGTGQTVFPGISQPNPIDPAWSPSGASLAFVSAGDIWVINADGSNEHRITTNGTAYRDPAWSPDGLKIAFTKGTSGISVINQDGTNETPVTASGNDKQPAYSPDGTKLAYRGSAGLWTMDVGGTNQVRIVADQINFPQCCDQLFENPAWQPVAQQVGTVSINGRVTYSNNSLQGVTVDLFGTVRATTTTDAAGNFQFSNLPVGGGYVVVPSLPRHYFTTPNQTFYNLTTNQTTNFEVAGVCQAGRCVKNGKIAFVRNNEILTINGDGTGETNITNNSAIDTEPNYSPDGSKIAFSSDRDGVRQIYSMAADGSGPLRLTNSVGTDTAPSYSPDGASIAFVSFRDGNSEIYRMNADGSNQTRLTNSTDFSDISPSFSADGSKIIWTKYGVTQGSTKAVYTMNVDGTSQQQLPVAATPLTSFERYTYSPDGSKIMYSYSPDASVVVKGTYTMNADGSGATAFPTGGTYGTYSPDGSLVVFTCCILNNTNKLMVANSAGSLSSQRTFSPSSSGNGLPDWQPLVMPLAPFDFDGDGRTDIAVHRPSNGVWYILGSTAGFSYRQWSDPGDVLVPADYDGDRKTDLAVWRPSNGTFYVINSYDNTYRSDAFGVAGDVPTGGDWDGDGRADVAVYRDGASVGSQSYFYYRGGMGNTQNVTTFVPWGTSGDKPVVGDYDGDGRTDAAIYRNGDWWVLKSSDAQYTGTHFGIAGDKVVPADYDGDGKTDMAVYRDGTWYLLRSRDGFAGFGFGIATDQPAPGDYDGDGKVDAAILRDGTWWILNSSNSQPSAVSFGTTNDNPVPGAFVR